MSLRLAGGGSRGGRSMAAAALAAVGTIAAVILISTRAASPVVLRFEPSVPVGAHISSHSSPSQHISGLTHVEVGVGRPPRAEILISLGRNPPGRDWARVHARQQGQAASIPPRRDALDLREGLWPRTVNTSIPTQKHFHWRPLAARGMGLYRMGASACATSVASRPGRHFGKFLTGPSLDLASEATGWYLVAL